MGIMFAEYQYKVIIGRKVHEWIDNPNFAYNSIPYLEIIHHVKKK